MTVLDETESLAGEPADARGRVAELQAIRAEALRGPSDKATAAQHAKGKLTSRERIELLLDEGSFNEVEQLRRHRATGFGLEAKKPYTDGVITGWGTVEGRTVFVYAHDFRIFGGALGEAHATKIHKIMDMAIAAGAPLVSLNDGSRRPHPGRRLGPRGLRRHLPAQHPRLRRHPADLGHARPVRGRRCLQPRPHRLRVHGPRDLANVHHRTGRRQGGHRRGDHPERPRRRGRPRRDERRRALRVRRRGDLHRGGPLPPVDAAAEQPGEPMRPPSRRTRRTAAPTCSWTWSRRTAAVRTT